MMSELTWVVAFISLYVTITWLSLLYLDIDEKKKSLKSHPTVAIAIPAFNEEKTITQTLDSISGLDYPKDRIEIIVINDGSTDGTLSAVKRYAKAHQSSCIKIIDRKVNSGKKSVGLNSALKATECEFFAVLDADSYVNPDCLMLMMPHFSDPKTGAVITSVLVSNPVNLLAKMQRLEYITSQLMRKAMSYLNTLNMTPGVLSVYRTGVLRKIGGFDELDLTEDFEIAMRLKYHKYNVKIEVGAKTYTEVPTTFMGLLRQRIRWLLGFFHNHWKYRGMFFKREYSYFGVWQLPLSLITPPMLLFLVGIMLFGAIKDTYNFVTRSLLIKNYFITRLTDIPTPKDYILGLNFKIVLLFYISALIGFYMLYIAHRLVKEKFRYPMALWLYIVVYPLIVSIHWVSTIITLVIKREKKW